MKIFVPMDSAAKALGAEEVVVALRAAAPDAEIVRTGVARHALAGAAGRGGDRRRARIAFGPVAPADVAGCPGRHQFGERPPAPRPTEEIAWLKRQKRLTFARCGVIDPLSLDGLSRRTAAWPACGGRLA